MVCIMSTAYNFFPLFYTSFPIKFIKRDNCSYQPVSSSSLTPLQFAMCLSIVLAHFYSKICFFSKNTSEATRRSSGRTEIGKCANVTNRRSRVGLSSQFTLVRQSSGEPSRRLGLLGNVAKNRPFAGSSHMVGNTLHSWDATFKTKELLPVQPDFPLF